MSTTRLPELPKPIRDKHGVPLFGSTQMHAYGLAVWKAAMEAAAKACEKARPHAPKEYWPWSDKDEAGSRACADAAAAIRRLPLPEQGGPQ